MDGIKALEASGTAATTPEPSGEEQSGHSQSTAVARVSGGRERQGACQGVAQVRHSTTSAGEGGTASQTMQRPSASHGRSTGEAITEPRTGSLAGGWRGETEKESGMGFEFTPQKGKAWWTRSHGSRLDPSNPSDQPAKAQFKAPHVMI